MWFKENRTGAVTIKFWELINNDNNTLQTIDCIHTLNVFNDKYKPVTVTSFSILDDLTQAAVGLANGALILMEGNLIKNTSREYRLLRSRSSCIVKVFFIHY